MPYLYHAKVSTKTDSVDSSLVRPSDWNARLHYANSAASGPSSTDAFVREVLTAGRTYYVRTDGSDANDGLTNSAAGAFLTLQKAMDTIVNSLDVAGFTVTISTTGTFATGISIGSWVGGGQVIFDGGGGTISTTGAGQDCLVVPGAISGVFVYQNVTLSSVSGYGIDQAAASKVVQGAGVTYNNCGIGVVSPTAEFYCFSDYNITGNNDVGAHMFCDSGFILNIGNTITFSSGAPIFSAGFADALDVAKIIAYSLVFVNSSVVTGVRYNVDLNSVITTNGGGATYFPGTTAGTSTNGGIYF